MPRTGPLPDEAAVAANNPTWRRPPGLRITLAAVTLTLTVLLTAADTPYRENLPIDHPAIRYTQSSATDPAAALAAGEAHLDLRALLARFQIDSSSQALVFSKTSFQAAKISPRNPRAIYFNDNVAVGWVRGSRDLEIAATDPHLGPIFYKYSGDDARLTRETVCLHCHQGAATLGVPGIFIGSVFPDSAGMPSRDGAIITDHRTPFADRWGGWYISALHGEQPDRANGVAADPAEPRAIANQGKRNLASLAKEVNLTGYLEPTSDIVALLTFEHQTQMTNLMTRLAWESRIAVADAKPAPDVEEIVAYMLFVDEVHLPESVEGVSHFTADFVRRGPRDRQGRSLRDFDLKTRLFRYPLSYMIYSAQFDALPAGVRARIYQRLFEILAGRDHTRKYAALSIEDRRAIFEILRETKPDLPDYWKSPV
jgi:hypothetical protein